MRLHISLDDELVRQLDQRVGKRRRSTFIGETVRRALDDERRWEDIEAGLGALAGGWRRDYARRGFTLRQADCLIAAAAVSVGARLATDNPKRFPMAELEVEHWPVGG